MYRQKIVLNRDTHLQAEIGYVFGDDTVYEFITYWDVPKKYLPDNSKFAKCYRIEFDGNEIIPETLEDESRNYSATIILK